MVNAPANPKQDPLPSGNNLDTLTTRFMILFLILLAIPLAAVIIFTTTLMSSYTTEQNTLALSRAQHLFNTQLNTLALQLQYEKKQIAFSQSCLNAGVSLCMLSSPGQRHENLVENPEFASLNQFLTEDSEPQNQRVFFSSAKKELLLLERETAYNKTHLLVGAPLNTRFLDRIYQQNPQLESEIWILMHNSQSQFDQAIKPSNAILKASQLSSVLPFLSHASPDSQIITLGANRFHLLRESLYSPADQKVATVLYLLPLSKNQFLLAKYHFGIGVIGLASFVFSVFLALLVSRSITQPIISLIDELNKVSQLGLMEKSSISVSEIKSRGVKEIQQVCHAFNRLISRLKQEQMIKDEFVATLTHDLKVPLLAEKQTIGYFLSELYGNVSPDQTEVLQSILTANRSSLSLVNGLLEIYRYETGKVSLVKAPFNLNDLLAETIEALAALAREKEIQLHMTTEMIPEECMICADRLEIKRVLNNLIGNAIMNTGRLGSIECSIKPGSVFPTSWVSRISSFEHTSLADPVNLDNKILLSIRDSGIGFSQTDLSTVFNRFSTSKNRGPMSMGLGLYNCYQVIMLHNGKIWVESTEGEGSVVSFSLPRHNTTLTPERRSLYDRRSSGG
jgi:signal transduction histidine kinase